MGADDVTGLVVAVGLAAYLIYALINAEKL
jgi:K+-transporting ATPase KdpF subunit